MHAWQKEPVIILTFTMPFHDISVFRGLVRLLRINPENEPLHSAEVARELEDLRKFSLNLLMAFFTVHTISPSRLLGTITLALVVYTINLHITFNTTFLQNRPVLSKCLHAIPLLGILCMTILKLVIVVQSPSVAAAVLLACALPLLVIWITRRYIEIVLPLPVQMREVTHVVPVSTDVPVALSYSQGPSRSP